MTRIVFVGLLAAGFSIASAIAIVKFLELTVVYGVVTFFILFFGILLWKGMV